MMVVQGEAEDDDESTVYILLPGNKSKENPEGGQSPDKKEEIPNVVKESIVKMNDLKFSCSQDTKVASNIKYLVLDLRFNKKVSK